MSKKRKILSPEEYKEICGFIMKYHGLTVECELKMTFERYTDIEHQTLSSIVQTELGQRTRSQHWRREALGKKHLKTFEERSANSWDTKILANIAVKENVSPITLCRAFLQEKYRFTNKSNITRLLKYPSLIEDVKLSANISQCLCCDAKEGPLIDLRRRVLGEEYEFLLKELATAAGMHFYDENDLRRLGYDKTPDIKLTLPFLYKEKTQLDRKFGSGIVIYWFGFRSDTSEMPENNVGIIVLDDFPNTEHMELLQLNEKDTKDTVLKS